MGRPVRFLLVDPINTRDAVQTYFPHLGLGYLASRLRQEFGSGVEFRVIRGHVAPWIHSWEPDIVGITSVSEHYDLAAMYAKVCKYDGLPVIAGGVHISTVPQSLSEDMDVAVVGEGEQTMVDLMRLFLSEGSLPPAQLSQIRGVAFRQDGKLVTTPPRAPVEPLDSLPMPARDIVKVKPHTSMFTSRGCPYRCVYCVSSRFWGKARFFSADYVVEEIDWLYRTYGVREISLLDDLFIADVGRMVAIMEGLAKKNLLGRLSFVCHVRSSLVSEYVARLLHDLGVKVVGIGIETGSQTTLHYLKGGVTVEEQARAIEVLRRHGIDPHPSFIIGAPEESLADLRQTECFIKENRITHFEAYVLIPFPGTPLWDDAKARGLVTDTMNWGRLAWNFGANRDPVILASRLRRDEIVRFYRKLMGRRKRYIRQAQATALLRQCVSDPVSMARGIWRRVW